MRTLFFILILNSFIFASIQNKTAMNTIKSVIKKEEFIALAVNKYIQQTGEIPKTTAEALNWTLLNSDDYLADFERTNEYTLNNLVTRFDANNNLFILGAIEKTDDYDSKQMFLYNFYQSALFRVNTIPPKDTSQVELLKGSQIKYNEVVKQIVKLKNDNKLISLDTKACPKLNYYYELKGEELIYKFCKADQKSIQVYQRPPIILEDLDDLQYIKAKVGDKVFGQKNNNWYEYYYQGDISGTSWVPVESGSILNSQDEEADAEDRIISYIPNAKDLVLRNDGGCMLANGDIFCWGSNHNKKAGIQTHGQLNPNFSPDFINTPVMLKVQIDNEVSITDNTGTSYTRRDKRWYNNPYRVKFEKMAINSTNVCGISPIFDYFQSGSYVKFGGDLYCNGRINSFYFEDVDTTQNLKEVRTSILKKNRFFSTGKQDKTEDGNETYLIDVAMVDRAMAVLSQAGDIYTFGINNKGVLGIDNSDETYINNIPTKVDTSGQVFKHLYALRDTKTFAALDDDNRLWVWGEKSDGTVLLKPTKDSSDRRFDPNRVFVNSDTLILRGDNKIFYRFENITNGISTQSISTSYVPSTALSVSTMLIPNHSSKVMERNYIYIGEDRKIYAHNLGSSRDDKLLTCRFKFDNYCTGQPNRDLFKNMIAKFDKTADEEGDFSNVSIFKTNNVSAVSFEDFEDSISGWNTNLVYDGNESTKFLGRFGKGVNLGSSTFSADGSQEVYKTYSFGSSNASKDVKISFVMYEIDSWDAGDYGGDGGITESLTVYINNNRVIQDTYKVDGSGEDKDDRHGYAITVLGSLGWADEKHYYELDSTLDSNGNLKLGFGAFLGEAMSNESFGIDNIKIEVKDSQKYFVCAMTGLGSASQMYCWGNSGRSLPLLSTSLYDVGKISSINKLFITQNSELNNSMTNNEFDNANKPFLKFPTYIGGFDYEFYFK
ncbi:hypothetical protein [Arcobacter roscoffensis]|uniref:Uncharacterized protein n=1 Tax=Arcobacter roscoffensis TaxID=2961520 RepID=A0ABY5E3D0_9BACT|nr:hypothetical protein [Arcobacter roscoffensis]UTJ06662.1 hypothetical protein NJU99_00805 [Arcobacter roscoffensis]